MKKYISLEHSIRTALTEGGVGFGTKGGDKAKGTPGAFYNSYSSKNGGHSAAGARVAAKDSGKENIKMEEDAGVPNEGNATPPVKAYGSFDEDGKKKKEVKEGFASGAAKLGGKIASKFAPGVGQAVAALDAADRYASGDTTGAAIAAAGAIPVVGGVADVVNAVRDVTGMSKSDKKDDKANPPETPTTVTPVSAPKTTAPNVSTSNQYNPKKSKRSIKEESGTADREKVVNVGRPNTAKNPFDNKSKLGKQAQIQRKIIDENRKLVAVVKKTKEEANLNAKTKDMGNVVINPPLNKPDLGTYNH